MTSLTREQILARARAATANDPPQVVGYSEAESRRLATIDRLLELRALWAREDRERAAAVTAPAPAQPDAEPPTKRSEGCGLEPPPDTHRPFPLLRVLRPGVPHSRDRASRAGSAPPPPTAPRRRAAELPVTTRRVRPAKRPLWGWLGRLWVLGGVG